MAKEKHDKQTPGGQHKTKRRKVASEKDAGPAAAAPSAAAQAAAPPAAAAAAAAAAAQRDPEPTGWEELERVEPVQQDAGGTFDS
jgi:hypothetical protein